ncbi:MAG: hypothetical protein C0434_07220 [Xanthomonadaceae bacterium]|nr:hypothetical protein [Xanthomonadaceae bacterium]
MLRRIAAPLLLTSLIIAPLAQRVDAQAPATAAQPAYGAPIAVDLARKLAAAAAAEAQKNKRNVAIAIVDTGGHLVYFEKLPETQTGSVEVSIDKARSAALFRRPTKSFQDTLAAGGEGLRVLKINGAVPLEGGLPIVADGRVIGAIGVSGATSEQDGQVAKAGAALSR